MTDSSEQAIAKAGLPLLREVIHDLVLCTGRFSSTEQSQVDAALALLEPIAAGTHCIVPKEPTAPMIAVADEMLEYLYCGDEVYRAMLAASKETGK